MEVSIIIPMFKPNDRIKGCLKSIKNQTFPKDDFEVLIILNGCNYPWINYLYDEVTILSEYNLSIIQTDVPGVSHARNIGIDRSRGNYIVFVDDDDLLSDNYLEELYKVSAKDIVGCSNSLNFVRDDSNFYFNFITNSYKKNIHRKYSIYGYRQFLSPPWCKMIHRNIIGSIRFPENINKSEDSIFGLSISKNISKMSLASPDCIYYWCQRPDSATWNNVNIVSELKDLVRIEIEYLKVYFSSPLSYNIPFTLSRMVGAIKNIYLRFTKNF